MSAYVVICCDGHREGERCTSQVHSGTRHAPTALAQVRGSGWTSRKGVGELCPSSVGHDEDSPAYWLVSR